ncbi:MAG: hypothetical protein H6R13_1644 [Proteobacteria bacterium]|nr:hypothetical protein [Pseudomonadota bacterium]
MLLDDRFGDAEFVDPVVQRGDVLFEREFADLLLGLWLQGGDQARFGSIAGIGEQQVRLAIGNGDAGLVLRFSIAELDDDAFALTVYAAVAQVLVAHYCA